MPSALSRAGSPCFYGGDEELQQSMPMPSNPSVPLGPGWSGEGTTGLPHNLSEPCPACSLNLKGLGETKY